MPWRTWEFIAMTPRSKYWKSPKQVYLGACVARHVFALECDLADHVPSGRAVLASALARPRPATSVPGARRDRAKTGAERRVLHGHPTPQRVHEL